MSYRAKINLLRRRNPFLSNTDLAYELLLEDLLTGRIQPGDKLSQSALAEQLDMSRSPVRDALLRLEENGFVSHTAQGFCAPMLRGREFADFMLFRTELECSAARLATHYASQEDLEAILRTLEEHQAAIDRHDDSQVSSLDMEFHSRIAAATHNLHFQRVHRQMMQKARFYLVRLKPQQIFELSLNRHRGIYQAIAAQDETAAVAAMKEHMSDAMRTALRVQGAE